MIGQIAELTKRQTERYYFSNIPIGTKFIILGKVNIGSYELVGYFLNIPPQETSPGNYHYTGYIEKGSYKILGEIKDFTNIFNW